MPASALLGNELIIQYLNTGVSPNAWTNISSAFDFGEFGEEKALVEITVLESTAREYRNGLPDGLEFQVQANFTANQTNFGFLYNAYLNNTTGSFRIVPNPQSSPQEGFQFSAIVRGWRITGTPGERSVATFIIKVSGAVTRI